MFKFINLVLKCLNVVLVVFVIIKLYRVLFLIILIVLVIDFIWEGNWNSELFVSFSIFVVREGLVFISLLIFLVLEWGLFNVECRCMYIFGNVNDFVVYEIYLFNDI